MTGGPLTCDVAVIGGGIVGVAAALELAGRSPAAVVVLEKENRLAAHQTGRNSGVIHSGLYYKPGSLKASLCAEGRKALIAFCEESGIPAEACGKVVVATRDEHVPRLEELRERGEANGLRGLRRISREELRELEPHAAGIAALHVPETGIVDYAGVTDAMARRFGGLGGVVRLGARLVAAHADGVRWRLGTTSGDVSCRFLVGCAGLESDRVARLCGVEPGVRIVPFRGEYYDLREERRSLVANLVYPVPDPRFPFLGVHFTRRITGGVEAGPNAVLAFRREGYSKTSFSLRDAASTLGWPGFWTLAGTYLATGLGEFWRSWNKGAFVAALRELVPEIEAADLVPGGSGVRAQALSADGRLVDDFHIVEAPRQIHVLNAPSPAATASLAIGRVIAERAISSFGLARRG
jgi:L-2-hydroxyglutarate oxidase